MKDPYAWVDPFAEIESANREAQRATQMARTAREDGRREVLNMVAGPAQEGFQRALSFAVERAAEGIANDVVKPQMAKDYGDYQRRQQEARVMADTLMLVSEPMMGHIGRDGKLTLAVQDRPMPQMTMRVETVRPFQYHVAMDPLTWKPNPRRA